MSKDILVNNIVELSNLCAVSSNEQVVASYLRNRYLDSSYQFEVDPIGNVLVHKNDIDKRTKERVIVFAHMDEIGFIIRKIETNGFLRFERVGGVNTQILPGTPVCINTANGSVHGVIGVQSHHFMGVDEKFKVPAITNLYIDVFAKSKEEVVSKGIDVGSFVTFKPNAQIIDDTFITGKSMDNRASMAAIMKISDILENESLPYDVYFCFPVMEEFNIRGIMPVIRRVQPDISIGIDITVACDTPDLNYNEIALGSGPAITVFNFHGRGTLAGVLPNKELLDSFTKLGSKLNIPLQKEVAPGVITENAFILFENHGVKVVNLSIPTRYTHTPNETVAISDVEQLVSLLVEFLKNRKEEIY